MGAKIILSFFIFALLSFFLSVPAYSASAFTRLIAIEDSYVDVDQPTTNFDGEDLRFEVRWVEDDSGPMPVYCPEITKQILLKFDLSAVDFEVSKARLRLMPTEPPLDAIVPTQAVGSADTWVESTVVWFGLPATETDALTPDGIVDDAGWIIWEDGSLATWLESQRTGDGIATLSMTIDVTVGCWPFPPDDEVALALSMTDRTSSYPPFLEVATKDDELPPPPDMTAITLSNIDTHYSSTIIFVASSLLLTGMTLWQITTTKPRIE